ncbi:hypothetical protein GGP85_001913 [Salinibacter ruber]|uniref:hypothetical protein n=1 Tax=Salinibacter ruber TaxID=146919 RepID=UPI002169CE7C|nr:hypothetical protein [Salinibacter ruber]MCS3826460.1 hypothetical protein [Salinibacter ruber]
MRVLIGTLYTGENEFEQSKHSLRQQTHTKWEQVVYKHLPNKKAHDQLYRTFMEQSEDFDLFLKLDADMVFRSEDSLQTLVDLFKREPELDHALLAVHDWASDTLIMGLHAYSKRVVWEASEEDLFVDHSPFIPGKRLSTKRPPAPIVDHSPNPSPFQAFRFGVHRALKVLQRDRSDLAVFRSRMQWDLLGNVWQRFCRTDIRRLGLIVLGAEQVLKGEVSQSEYDDDSNDLRRRFERNFADLPIEAIKERLRSHWKNGLQRESVYLRNVGMGRLLTSACVEIPKRLAAFTYRTVSADYM